MPAIQRPLLTMLEEAYRVRFWSEYFETYESKKIGGPLGWVAVPTKHDSQGYKRVSALKNGPEILCAWWSILQVAGRSPVHGLLAGREGPFEADDIAEKANLPAKIFRLALPVLIEPKIGWLETVPWNIKLDFAGNIAALVTSQHLTAEPLCIQRIIAGNSGKQRAIKGASPSGETSRHAVSPATASVSAVIPADKSADAVTAELHSVQDRTGHNRTGQSPLPSPDGDKEVSDLVGLVEARALICKKILGGKDPHRLWGPEAENRLAILVEQGLPRREIEDIAWFRGLPPNDEIPELKARRFPIAETTLMNYWGDQLTYARAYRAKVAASLNGSAKKKEPAGWKEFFRSLYPESTDLRLPDSFYQLPKEDRDRWEREHEDWELKNPAEEMTQ